MEVQPSQELYIKNVWFSTENRNKLLARGKLVEWLDLAKNYRLLLESGPDLFRCTKCCRSSVAQCTGFYMKLGAPVQSSSRTLVLWPWCS